VGCHKRGEKGFKNAPIPDSGFLFFFFFCFFGPKPRRREEMSPKPPRRADWDNWLDSLTYLRFRKEVMGIREAGISTEVVKVFESGSWRTGGWASR